MDEFLALMPNKVTRPKQDAPKHFYGFGAITVKLFSANKLNSSSGSSMHLLWDKSISRTGGGGLPVSVASGNSGPLDAQDVCEMATL